jgi:hypothetical protein
LLKIEAIERQDCSVIAWRNVNWAEAESHSTLHLIYMVMFRQLMAGLMAVIFDAAEQFS